MKTRSAGRTNHNLALYGFEVPDSRGRLIGARIETWEEDYIESEVHGWSDCRTPGHYFVFRPKATRNGSGYGPSQRDRYFRSEVERDQAIGAYLTGARKRAAKGVR